MCVKRYAFQKLPENRRENTWTDIYNLQQLSAFCSGGALPLQVSSDKGHDIGLQKLIFFSEKL